MKYGVLEMTSREWKDLNYIDCLRYYNLNVWNYQKVNLITK